MKLRKGMLGALLGVTFATTLLSTSIVHADNNYTSTVGDVAVRTIRDDENMIGWKKINNQWYYLDSAGNYVKGWINVDGKQYYLKADGTRATNTIIGDYIFGNEGVGYQGKNKNGKFYFADGWYYNFSDKKVYYPNHTSLKVGDDGKVYADERRVAFDSQGVLQSNWFKINRLWYSLNLSGKALIGWQKIDEHWYYFNEFGTPHIGWLKLKDNWYYFDKYTGIMHTYMMYTGTPIIITGETYYFDPKTGAMQTGWVTYESGDKYYFYSDGRMARNTKIGEYTIDNYGRAYIENYTGWQKRYDDWTYYENGKMITGWKFINNNWYYFDLYGRMATGLESPIGLHGGGWYLFDSSGVMKTGWQKYNGEWCYFGSSGNMHMGWQKIDSKWYYFGPSKNMPELWTVNDKGVWYEYNISGAMKTGWQKIDGAWYYFDSSGAMKTGWLDDKGKKYYLQPSGAMATNTTVGEYKIDTAGIASKIVKNGWQSVNNHWYYYTNSKKVTGWKAVNNVWYYFDSSGVMKTGWQKVNGVWYYFNPSGAMQKGWQKIDGAWYYFSTSGAMKTGWLDYAGQKYYLQSSGAMATNTTVDGYAINAAGVAINKQVKELDDAKTSAIEQLKALNLKDQLNAYTTRIANAKTTDEIVTIVNEAKAAETKAIAEANKPKPGSTNSILTNPEAKRTFILTFTQLLNDFRKENGLKEIYSTTLLNRAADIRSEDEKNGLISMYQNGQTTPDWNHKRPDGSGTESALDQARMEGFNLLKNGTTTSVVTQGWVNENIAINYQMPKRSKETPEVVAQRVFTQWKNSAGHRKNMLSPRAELFGIGFWGDQSQSGPYIEFTYISGEMASGFTKDDIQLFQ